MNFQVSLTMAGIVVIAGRWAEDKQLDAQAAVGTVVVILMLFAVNGASEPLANGFGGLILVAALLRYVPSLTKASGGKSVSQVVHHA